MANFHGKTGFVHWTNAETEIPEVLNWSLSATAEVADQTAMQDTWKTHLAGFKDWTVTLECSAPAAGPTIPYTTGLGADVSGDTTQLVLYMAYAFEYYKYIWGTAICTGIAYSVDANDVGKLTYTFQGHGLLQVGSNTGGGATPKEFT